MLGHFPAGGSAQSPAPSGCPRHLQPSVEAREQVKSAPASRGWERCRLGLGHSLAPGRVLGLHILQPLEAGHQPRVNLSNPQARLGTPPTPVSSYATVPWVGDRPSVGVCHCVLNASVTGVTPPHTTGAPPGRRDTESRLVTSPGLCVPVAKCQGGPFLPQVLRRCPQDVFRGSP